MAAPKALASRFRPKSLADLNLKPGIKLQVVDQVAKSQYRLELVGVIAHQYLLIRAPKSQAGRVRRALRIRLLVDNWICAFNSDVEQAVDAGVPLWLVSYPERIEVAKFREETRLPITLRVRVDGPEPHQGPDGEFGLIVDLNLRGAQLESANSLGAVGDSIHISTEICVAQTQHLVMLAARIVSVNHSEGDALPLFRYGVEFEPIDEETRICLFGFIAQQLLDRLGYPLP